MKKQIEKLIDQLVNKTLTRGCRIYLDKAESLNSIILDGPIWTDGNEQYIDGTAYEYGFYLGISKVKIRKNGVDLVEILGHPIMISDILKLKDQDFWMQPVKVGISPLDALYFHWSNISINMPLQKIFACEWEKWCIHSTKGSKRCNYCGEFCLSVKGEHLETPKDQNIKTLGEFLLSLNLIKK